MNHPWRRGLAIALGALLVLSAVPNLVDARGHPDQLDRDGFQPDYAQCIKPSQSPEIYGPTDVNAQTANGGMAVGLNDDATVTVFRYPRPSMFDQVKYHTSDREAPRMGAAPNEGAFLGLSVQRLDGASASQETTWLRDWDVSQRYEDGLSDTVVTTFTNDTLGLQATIRDVVAAPPTDVLARDVTVAREPSSDVVDARLLAFENWNLVVSKYPLFPTQDWCQEEENRDRARYLHREDAIVHTKSGIDRSTGQVRKVAVAMGFDGPSSGHQVGGDAYEPSASPLARGPTPVQDAYDDAADGVLRGNDGYRGQTTGVLARDLTFEGSPLGSQVAEATLYVAGGQNREDVDDAISAARESGFGDLDAAKEDWIQEVLDDPPTPDDAAPEAVQELSRRAIVTLATNVDRHSRAIVASITTQSPYGQDWIRDGAYFNVALNVLGLHDWVADHNRWYAEVQQKATDPDAREPLTPPGNWAMVYYGDGVAGGPIPYEIDETGYGVWTLWRHHHVTGDQAYLEDVYPALQRAADFLVDCEDHSNDLQCHSWEDDNYVPTQTIVGAQSTWLALDAAQDAALAMWNATGDEAYLEDAQRYETRREDLAPAIDENLWDDRQEQYGSGDRATRTSRSVTGLPVLPPSAAPAEMAWPVCYDPAPGFPDARMDLHRQSLWDRINRTFDEPGDTADNGDEDLGLYESKGLLALAKHWKGQPERMDQVRRGLEWVATEHATPDTHVMGEAWVEADGEIESRVAMPHTWEQILFYLASLEAYPPDGVADQAQAGCGGVLAQLTGAAS